MYTQAIIAAHPDVRGAVNTALVAAIDEMYACAQACTSCADGCLAEQRVTALRQCIRLNLDCADVRHHSHTREPQNGLGRRGRPQYARCVHHGLPSVRRECQRHASHHGHCRICADACRKCEVACQQALP